MKILSIETSAKTAGCALTEDEKLICEYTLNTGRTHSQTLLPMVESMMKNADMKISDVDMFTCTAGPGSFTGVRIGISTVKGLAFAKNKPCVPVSTLLSIATNLKSYSGIICPVMDARRNTVYNALFESKNGNLTRLCEDRIISLEELKEELLQYSKNGHSIYFAGDGYSLAKGYIDLENIYDTPERLIYQSAYSTAVCALSIYENNPGSDYSDEAISPIYLRPSQAERERLEKESK